MCKKCGELKSPEEFYTRDIGVRYECISCHNIRNRLRIYNMSKSEFEEMKNKQNNKCLICLREARLSVDHDHKTGKIRGLLCNWCNSYLGAVEKDIEILDRMRSYLC